MSRKVCTFLCLVTVVLIVACDEDPVGPTVADLEVSALASPDTVVLGSSDSLTVTISVFNPGDNEIRVTLGDGGFRQTSDPKTSEGLGYRFRLFDSDGDYHGGAATWGKHAYQFEARETKTHTFVLPLNSSDVIETLQLEPGAFDVVSSFGSVIGDTVDVQIVAG